MINEQVIRRAGILLSMNFDEFSHFVGEREYPIVLTEGSRNLPVSDRSTLVTLVIKLAREFPHALFRTGNATGSDEAFAEGVNLVDPVRLQYVLPRSSMGRERRIHAAYSISIEDLPRIEEQSIVYETKRATPKNIPVIEAYERKMTGGRRYAQSLYLLRDTLKVLGSKELGLAPADIGIFYLNSRKPTGGGTGHTIRVCKQNNVPVIEQREWMAWCEGELGSSGDLEAVKKSKSTTENTESTEKEQD